MNQKRKLLALLLVLLLLTGCAAGAGSEETEAPTQTAIEAAAPAETVPETTEAPVTKPTEMPVPETTEAPAEETVSYEVTITPVITSAQTQVTVTTADEFLAAIAPDTEIIVDAPLIDFSEASDYGVGEGSYYYWQETFDGPELMIYEVSNLTIRGSGEDRTANVLSSVPRYSNVLCFQHCSNIHVVGLTAGHTEEPGSCTGGVLYFENSQDILIENCGLFGCGTLGVIGYSSKNMQIVNNEIYECSLGGVEFTNCDDVNVDGNTFRDLGGRVFRVYSCGSITCNGESVGDFSPRQ